MSSELSYTMSSELSYDITSKMEKKEAEIATIKAEIATIKAEITPIKAEIATIVVEISTIKAEIVITNENIIRAENDGNLPEIDQLRIILAEQNISLNESIAERDQLRTLLVSKTNLLTTLVKKQSILCGNGTFLTNSLSKFTNI